MLFGPRLDWRFGPEYEHLFTGQAAMPERPHLVVLASVLVECSVRSPRIQTRTKKEFRVTSECTSDHTSLYKTYSALVHIRHPKLKSVFFS